LSNNDASFPGGIQTIWGITLQVESAYSWRICRCGAAKRIRQLFERQIPDLKTAGSAPAPEIDMASHPVLPKHER
jgi:hypothetical protein